MKKRYKAIFGNPPYSMKSGDSHSAKVDLWHRFAMASMDMAHEVYYITPLIWNGKHKEFTRDISKKCGKVELDAGKQFGGVALGICYWNTHKRGMVNISDGDYKIEVNNITDIKYVPFKASETMSIHRKCWDKDAMRVMKFGYDMLKLKEDDNLRRESDDEYRHPVFSTNIYNLYYTNDEGKTKYRDHYGIPKIIIGRCRNNTPIYDKEGIYATTSMAVVIIGDSDTLAIRYKQLSTKLAKFWYETGRQETGDSMSGIVYHAAIYNFPDIPLSITEDDAIYEWLGLTEDEIKVVEKYADKVDALNQRREDKYEKAI